MPTAAEHLAKATHNRRVLGLLDLAQAADWATVVAFYTALHQIERLADLDGRHHEQHIDRTAYIQRHPDHSQILLDYRRLSHAAHVARYGTRAEFARDFPATYVRRTLIESHLTVIERYVESVFAPPPPPTPES
jgi:hypothetical protein